MKRQKNPYKDYLNIDDVIGCCFDPTTFIQDLNSLNKEQLNEFKQHIQFEMKQPYWNKLDWYEAGPVWYILDHIKT